MLLHLAAPVVALLLVADPGPAPDTVPPDAVPLSQAATIADQLGHTVGATAECGMGDDVDEAMAKAEETVRRAAVTDDADDLEMNDRFHEAIEVGRELVLDGSADCDKVRTELKKIQGQQPD